jgi:hypothetical protein
MDGCRQVSTLDDAMQPIDSSVVPIKGLRRDLKGNLTDDSLQTIIDGLKSRGINPTDGDTLQMLLKQLNVLLCSVYNQYMYLINELSRQPTEEVVDALKEKNGFLLDILRVSRHLLLQEPFDGSNAFIEGWQAAPQKGQMNGTSEGFQAQLERERMLLETKQYDVIKAERLSQSGEKNRNIDNNLGLYGFLNILAIGLLLYVAGASTGGGGP